MADEQPYEQWFEHTRTWYPASELWQTARQQANAAAKATGSRQIRRHAMTAILFASFAFEAFLNVSCESLLGEDLWALLDDGRFLRTKTKLELVGHRLGADGLLGREPFQTVMNAKKLRDFVAHGRPVTTTGRVVVYTRGERPSEHNVPLSEVEQQCTPANAESVVQAVLESTRELTKLSQVAEKAGRIERPLGSIGHHEDGCTKQIPRPDDAPDQPTAVE